jgi:ParB family chromosome partitioning protein
LIAAKALQAFSDSEDLAAVIVEVFNDRADQDCFAVDAKVIRSIAEMLVFSKPHVQSRAVMLLSNLNDTKQAKWDFGWKWFERRFGTELGLVEKQAKSQSIPKVETNQQTLDQLAFGTYVGLSREQGGFHYRKYWPRFGWSVETVRLAALRRLAMMSDVDSDFVGPTISVMTHACSCPWRSVRELAFETLKKLGVDDEQRAQIGIATGQFDLAVAGLGLLTDSATASKRKGVLTEAILNQPGSIAFEAAKMLREDIGSVKTADVCMDSANEAVKKSAVVWLAEDCETEAAALKVLRSLAADAPLAVKHAAIEQLVIKRDEKAFDSIADVLRAMNPKIKRRICYRWLLQLRDDRTSDFLLDLLDQQKKSLNIGELLGIVGQLRDSSIGDRLLQLIDEKDVAAEAIKAIKMVSGFDQRIQDPNDLRPMDRTWMDKQHPRHGDLLAKTMDRVIELGETSHARGLVASARWCLTNQVDPPLGRLCSSPDEMVRHLAIEAVSFRAEKRDGPVDILKNVVSHRDPVTQFLAAEGLAKAGHDDGLQVLMSAVEMMEDLRMRQRAVLAIGHLADERGLDLLLKLVTHDAHALQDSAAEAIGYLGRSSQKEKIFGILNKLVAQEGTAGSRAIIGLRHMNTLEAWDVIRSKAKTSSQSLSAAVVIDQLGYDTSSATQDLLIELLERYPKYLQVQLTSARRSFGTDSIVPDLALLKGRSINQARLGPMELESLNRVCDSATAQQIFELTNRCPDQARSRLADHLLMQKELPVKEAVSNLESQFSPTVELAARIVGRDGDPKHSKLVQIVLSKRAESYSLESNRLLRQNEVGLDEFQQDKSTLLVLIWAAGRVGGCEKLLLEIVTSNASNEHFAQLRAAALDGLQGAKLTAAMQTQIQVLLEDYDSAVRLRAAELLTGQAKTKPEDIGDALMADRFTFDWIAERENLKLESVFQKSVSSAHYQPRSLLKMAKSKDLKTLVAVAEDESLDTNSRLGAIEGLSKMADKKSEKALLSLGKSADNEELRKAAWRGLRRSKRAGAKS